MRTARVRALPRRRFRSSARLVIMVKIALKPPALAALDTAAFSSTATEQVPMIENNGPQETVGKRRVRRCALFAAPMAVVAACLTISSTQQDPFHECDRQCRSAYGFFDRSVTGARVGALGQHCSCSRAGAPLGDLQPYQSHKAWNSSFWCGDFETSLVCAAPPPAGEVEAPSAPLTTTRGEAALQGLQVHCGLALAFALALALALAFALALVLALPQP